MVNAIPETAVLESYVRGASFDAIVSANRKVNQALCGAALSIGTNIEIIDIPGYAPLINDKNMIQVAAEAVQLAIPEHEFTVRETIESGSTDMGDLSCIMPVVHPYAGGAQGLSHGNNYEIVDPVAACVDSAKMQLGMLWLLLSDDAKRAKQVIAEYKPLFASKEAYLAYMDALNDSGDRIQYDANGISATVRI